MPDEALDMPAVQFFTLLVEGNEMRRLERDAMLNDMLDIQAVTVADYSYYTRMVERFRSRLTPLRAPEALGGDAVEAASVDAQNAMIGIFGGVYG